MVDQKVETSSSSNGMLSVLDNVLRTGTGLPGNYHPEIKGYDFNNAADGVDYKALFESYLTTGFQATKLAAAVDEINKMVSKIMIWLCIHKYKITVMFISKSQLNWKPMDSGMEENPTRPTRCDIFLGYTSNLVSSGLREHIRFLAQHRLISCIVTTAGGVEEDLIKCLSPTFLGSFDTWKGHELRERACNRIGNLLVPNDNYCAFEDWVMPILDQMLIEQELKNYSSADGEDADEEGNGAGISWTPSKVIERLGREINDEKSIYYWCAKNGIPVYCPALTDGSLGDMLYIHSVRNSPRALKIDIVRDLHDINRRAAFAAHTGCIILGGGVVKHHILNANLMRNGCDHAVFVNTGMEYDGSDAGATPDEAVSWGKIGMDAKPVKVNDLMGPYRTYSNSIYLLINTYF